MRNSREKSLVINSLIIGMGTFLPRFASIVTLPIITGCLTKTDYGIYDLVVVLISLIMPLATLQIQSAAFRFLIDKRDNKYDSSEIVTNILFFVSIVSVIVVLIMFHALFKYPLITRIIICLYFVADIIMQDFQEISRGLGKNKVYSGSSVLNAIINLIAVYVFIKILGFGLNGVILSLLVANTTTSFFIFLVSRLYTLIDCRLINWNVIKQMVAYSWPFIPNNLSSWIMTLSDRMLLALFMGVEVNATYAISKKIPNLLSAVQSTFSLAWIENASLSSKDADIDDYYSKMFDFIFGITVGGCALLIGMSKPLFSLLIKGDYSEAYAQMPVLFIGMVFMTLASYLAGIYVADKRTKEIGITTTIAAIINLVIDVVAIPFIGMWAASFSTLISYIFLFVYRIYDLKKIHNITYPKKKMVTYLIAIIVLCMASELSVVLIDCVIFFVGCLICLGLNRTLINTIIFKVKK